MAIRYTKTHLLCFFREVGQKHRGTVRESATSTDSPMSGPRIELQITCNLVEMDKVYTMCVYFDMSVEKNEWNNLVSHLGVDDIRKEMLDCIS
jgi:hypothetical protein